MRKRTSLNYEDAPMCYKSKPYAFVGSTYDMWRINGNCTHYAYARTCELAGGKDIRNDLMPFFPDAGLWLENAKWETGTEPREGAIGVCENHVFIVEEVYEDGRYLISQSSYTEFIFGTALKNTVVGQRFYAGSGKLLGFIYNPYIESAITVTGNITDSFEAIDCIARDVINGKYGNGRIVRMTNLYTTIQKRVNEILGG